MSGRTRFFCPKCGLRFEGRIDQHGGVHAYDRAGWNGKVEQATCVACSQTKETTMTIDFTVDNHGSIVILNAHTEAAKAWIAEHLPDERTTWGANGTVVEPRYIGDIVSGIEADGLRVE